MPRGENKSYSQICSVKIAGEQDRSVLIVKQTIEEMTAMSCVVRLYFYQSMLLFECFTKNQKNINVHLCFAGAL